MRAEACTVGVGPALNVVGSSFPNNGVVGIQSYCNISCDGYGPPTDLQVVDGSGQLVTGSLIDGGPTPSGYWAAWKPDQVFPADTMLEVTATLPSAPGFPLTLQHPLTVTGEHLLDAQALNYDLPLLVYQTPLGAGSCCVNATVSSCATKLPCVYEEGTSHLRATVEFDPPPELLGQFAYRVTWSAAGNPTWQSDWDIIFTKQSADFEVEAPEYCTELELKRLVDGELTALEPRCVPHGDLGPLGVTPWPESSNLLALTSCTVPPPELHAEWCANLDQVSECTAEDCTNAKAACDTQPATVNADDSGAVGVAEDSASCAMVATRPGPGNGWLTIPALLLLVARRPARAASSLRS